MKSNAIDIDKISIKDVLIEWCEESSSHGISRIARSKNIIVNVIWLSCFIASASYCVISIVSNIEDYFSNKSYINSEIVQDTTTNFPAVTFCNLKMTNKVRAKDYINNALYVNNESVVNKQYYIKWPHFYSDDVSMIIGNKITNDANLTQSDREELGFKLDEMLLTCSYSWDVCTVDDFVYSFHPLFGNCYTFNKGVNSSIKKVSLPGADYGLRLDIFVGDPKVHTNYEINDGVIIVVHNQTMNPLLNNDRVLVATGTDTDIKVNRNFVSRLSPPYSSCLEDTSVYSGFKSEYFEYMVRIQNTTYDQHVCFLLCFQKYLNKKCNCVIGVLPKYDAAICTTFEQMTCATDNLIEFQKGASHSCILDCPVPCVTIEYKVATNFASFPTKYYRDLLSELPVINKSGIAYEDIDKSVLRINVYYETMTYTSIVETPALTPEMFFSNIGGTLGLYLGISVLSVIEIVELIIKVAGIMYARRRKKRIATMTTF